jgi:hypothetical protein
MKLCEHAQGKRCHRSYLDLSPLAAESRPPLNNSQLSAFLLLRKGASGGEESQVPTRRPARSDWQQEQDAGGTERAGGVAERVRGGGQISSAAAALHLFSALGGVGGRGASCPEGDDPQSRGWGLPAWLRRTLIGGPGPQGS